MSEHDVKTTTHLVEQNSADAFKTIIHIRIEFVFTLFTFPNKGASNTQIKGRGEKKGTIRLKRKINVIATSVFFSVVVYR